MISLLILTIGLALEAQAYLNTYDHPLNYTCPHGNQSITHIESVHNSKDEDRIFDLACSYLPLSSKSVPSCYWTDYQNAFDELLSFMCPTNYYISGVYSEHSNDHEDRRWKFFCCSLADIHMSDCSHTGWTNDYDQPQNFTLPAYQVMKGVISVHNNGPEDRIYKYVSCSIDKFNCGALVG